MYTFLWLKYQYMAKILSHHFGNFALECRNQKIIWPKRQIVSQLLLRCKIHKVIVPETYKFINKKDRFKLRKAAYWNGANCVRLNSSKQDQMDHLIVPALCLTRRIQDTPRSRYNSPFQAKSRIPFFSNTHLHCIEFKCNTESLAEEQLTKNSHNTARKKGFKGMFGWNLR